MVLLFALRIYFPDDILSIEHSKNKKIKINGFLEFFQIGITILMFFRWVLII